MNKKTVQKHTALLSAGVLMLAAFPVQTAYAADAPAILILGDSVSAGTGLAEGECGYYDYIADCTGGTLTNLAVSGMTTADLLGVIENAVNKDTIADADIICVSIGGNDLMQPAKEYFGSFAEEGENLMDTAKRIAKEADAKEIVTGLTRALRTPRKTAVENYSVIAEKLRALNPDAQIVFQTLYNPFELSQDDLNSSGYSAETLKKYDTLMTYVVNNEKQLNDAMKEVETVKIADVSAAFAGAGWLYDGILKKDVHPSPLGHALIAATVLEQLTGVSAKSARMANTVEGLTRSFYLQIPADDLAAIGKYALDVQYYKGDFDNNGAVSIEDAQSVLKVYTNGVAGKKIEDNVTALQFITGDVNEDSAISVEDAQFILMYYVKKYVSGQDVTWDQIVPKKK